MSLFKRIQTNDQRSAAAIPPVSADDVRQHDVTSLEITQASTVKTKSGTKRKPIDVVSALYDALGKYGVKPKLYSQEWARIPAVWRHSLDYNISVNLKSGVTIDFVNNSEPISFKELMSLLEHAPGDVELKKTTGAEIQNNATQRIRDALSIWKKATPLTSDSPPCRVARRYLEETRGLPGELSKKVYGQIRALQGDYGGVTLVLPIYQPSSNGNIIGIQRIFLTAEGEKYGDRPKAMLGTHFSGNKSGGFLISGDSSRFNKTEIALVEGFETGLAVNIATGMPVYVLYDTNGIKRVCVEYLSSLGVTGVLIAADNDDPDKYGVRAGQDAADDTAGRIIKESGAPVRIALPPRKYTEGKPCDWLNVWNKDPAATARLILSAPAFVAKQEDAPKVRSTMRSIFSAPKV